MGFDSSATRWVPPCVPDSLAVVSRLVLGVVADAAKSLERRPAGRLPFDKVEFAEQHLSYHRVPQGAVGFL